MKSTKPGPSADLSDQSEKYIPDTVVFSFSFSFFYFFLSFFLPMTQPTGTMLVPEPTVLRVRRWTPAPGKKTCGRRKIDIIYIDDKNRRHVTQSKRKGGVVKKVKELYALTHMDSFLLLRSESGVMTPVATGEFARLLDAHPSVLQQLLTLLGNAPKPSSSSSSVSSAGPTLLDNDDDDEDNAGTANDNGDDEDEEDDDEEDENTTDGTDVDDVPAPASSSSVVDAMQEDPCSHISVDYSHISRLRYEFIHPLRTRLDRVSAKLFAEAKHLSL
jgi:hypothetical protein